MWDTHAIQLAGISICQRVSAAESLNASSELCNSCVTSNQGPWSGLFSWIVSLINCLLAWLRLVNIDGTPVSFLFFTLTVLEHGISLSKNWMMNHNFYQGIHCYRMPIMLRRVLEKVSNFYYITACSRSVNHCCKTRFFNGITKQLLYNLIIIIVVSVCGIFGCIAVINRNVASSGALQSPTEVIWIK